MKVEQLALEVACVAQLQLARLGMVGIDLVAWGHTHYQCQFAGQENQRVMMLIVVVAAKLVEKMEVVSIVVVLDYSWPHTDFLQSWYCLHMPEEDSL